MKAMLLDQFGDPSHFRLGHLPDPVAGPGQVLVCVAAASVNPVDYKIRRRGGAIAPEPPVVLGCDVAGVVESVGEGVTGFARGDRVYGCVGGVKGLPGTYAELVAADARLLARAPSRLTLREAAALPLVTITAWEGLFDRADLQPGESVLVHGGAGGVGHVAIQLARAKGARVAATVSTPEKAEIARRLGAEETIDYRTEAPAAYVARLTGGRGFDVVFDATGGSDLPASFAAARLNGRVVTIVASYTADLALMHTKGLSLHVVFMLIPLLHDRGRERHGAILREAAALADAGRLRPLLDPGSFHLADAAEAHRHLEGGRAVGKVVIEVDSSLE